MDLIDRDALMKDMKSDCPEIDVCIAETSCIECIIGRQTAVNRWISCSERMPEDGELVLIAHVSGAVYIADRDGKYWEEDSGEWYDGENVTHWMPLPEPPEGGADDAT